MLSHQEMANELAKYSYIVVAVQVEHLLLHNKSIKLEKH